MGACRPWLTSSLAGQVTNVRNELPGGIPRLTAIAALSNLAAASTAYVRPYLIERGATEALLGVVVEPETQVVEPSRRVSPYLLASVRRV
jgi:hypothetical protein